LLPIAFASAQESSESSMLEKFNLKPIESVINERGEEIDPETKVLRDNRNESFKSESKEANEVALSFLQARRELYGLSDNPNDFKIERQQKTPSGEYLYFQQYLNGIPVFATNFTVYINKENIVKIALNEFRNVAKYKNVETIPAITDADALTIAKEYLNVNGYIIGNPKTELVYFESIDKGLELA
jgi:Zn-dependent metalloprotease